MDIKGIVRGMLPLNIGNVQEARAQKQPNATEDREGNGQAAQEEQKKRKLTPQEIETAIKFLNEHPGVKEHHLIIKLKDDAGSPVVYIEDQEGKVIRRIPESDLGQLIKNKEKSNGHILNRAS